MNRFHLLALEDEDTSSHPVAPVAVKAAVAKPVPAAKAEVATNGNPKPSTGGKPKDSAPRTRHSRSGPRKGEGEKHQTVGKGSWGRAVEDASAVATNAEVTGEAVEATGEVAAAEAVVPEVQIAYKTVQEYLVEQEEQARRLAALSKTSVRRANEGAEVDASAMEVVKKADINVVKKETVIVKESNVTRLSLQDLNKLHPMAAPKRTERVERSDRPERTERGERGERTGGDRRPGNNNTRRPDNRDNRDSRKPRENNTTENVTVKAKSVNLKDQKSFPALA